MLDMFYTAYRCRPIFGGSKWLLEEPAGGFPADPFLRISGPMSLEGEIGEVGRRVASFLSPDMKFTEETRPKSIDVTSQYGLISEIERLQYEAYFATSETELASILAKKIIPFLKARLGATHCCVVRPNLKLQQTRLSLVKALWAVSMFSRGEAQKKITVERVLDSVLPLAHDTANWLHIFLSSPPLQVTLTFQCLGGYILFYQRGPWTFPYAAAAGIYGRFNVAPSLDTSDGGMRSGIWLRPGSAEGIYRYLRAVTQLVDALSFYALNPANFLTERKLDSSRQIQFVAAMGLLLWDVLSANQTPSMYAKVSFSLSALDKFANIVEAMTNGRIKEAHAFKACFSSTTALGLRWIARHAVANDAVTSTLLRVQARHILCVHKAVRAQASAATSEAQRLEWLRSYRNLRHGTFLNRDQFGNLFVAAKGLAPSDLARVVMALLIGLAVDPNRVFDLFEAQAKA
jgi:hypothetical protein